MSNQRRIANEIITGETKQAVKIHREKRLCGGFKKSIEDERNNKVKMN
ncbi:MAG: hypothetical protein ACI4N3_01115 [Alphaproteobacteria bacterium]